MKVKILHGFSKYAKVTAHKNQLTLNDPIIMPHPSMMPCDHFFTWLSRHCGV